MYSESETEKLAAEYMEKGRTAFFSKELNKAAALTQNAIDIYRTEKNYEQYAYAQNMMGVIYISLGNESAAMDCYLEVLECSKKHGVTSVLALAYNNIGSRYQELQQHGKAIDYFEKSADELEKVTDTENENFQIRYLITHMNLMKSYGEIDRLDDACEELLKLEKYSKGIMNGMYYYSYLTLKSRLYWSIGRKEYVYEHLDELIKGGIDDSNAADYIEDMSDLCALLKDMREFDKWKKVILVFEQYVKKQHSVYYEMLLTEMWLEYYKELGDTEQYVKLCIHYVDVSQQQKKADNEERARAIDLKIELQEKEEQRRHAEIRSNQDALTGLGNRYMLEKDAVDVIGQAIKTGKKIAVGILDIDCFKQHNDTYGHIQGDRCLQLVADVLKAAVAGCGKAYRYGGDEFVLMIQNGEEDVITGIARTIKENLQQLHIEDKGSGRQVTVTISQGYASFLPDKQENRNSLIEHADKALYEVKENGRDGFRIIVE
jgi:diguanylate cyclase (GGDEF)-like protein